jgi:hypothetical protein
LTLYPARQASAHQPPRLPSLTRLVPSGDQPQSSYHGHRQQDRRRLSRVSKPAVNSPSTYGAYTPIQVVPSWQGIPYGWTPVSMPIQIPMQPPTASHHQIFSPQTHRSHAQQQQQPSPASTATPSSTTTNPTPQLREDLWKVGGQYLCNPTMADAYVRAVEIRHGSTMSTSSVTDVRDDELDLDGAGEKSPSPPTAIPVNPFGNSLLLRIVIHSPGRSSMAMTREFDRRKLRDTIPDFARSPKSPKSGTSTDTTVAASTTTSTPLSAASSPSLARRRKSHVRAQQAGTPATPISAGPTRRLTMPPVPIRTSLPLAPAFLPCCRRLR